MKRNVTRTIDLDRLYRDHYRTPSVPDSLWQGVQARIASGNKDEAVVMFPTVRPSRLRFRVLMGAAAAVLFAVAGVWITLREDPSRSDILAAIDQRYAQVNHVAESVGNPFSGMARMPSTADENPFQPLTPRQLREVPDANPFGNK